EDPVPKLLACAQDLFAGASIEALGGTVRDRASQYLAALTDRRYLGVELDSAGNASVVAPGRSVPAGQLDDRDLDLLYLAIKLTLVEKLAPLSQVSFILDEPFIGWDEPKLQLVSRMLKHIGTMTQVVHASALPAHRNLADNAAQI
ncbi:MAG: chromosome segregation protein SMC, partial [Myxococcales bacterium]